MYIIKSYEGFDDVKFGMTAKEIKKIMHKKPRRFYKAYGDRYKSDDYSDVYIYYDSNYLSEAMEFNRQAIVKFEDMLLFDLKYQDLEYRIMSLDENIEVDESGFTSKKLGIGVYIIDKESNGFVDSVIVFKKGYYD